MSYMLGAINSSITGLASYVVSLGRFGREAESFGSEGMLTVPPVEFENHDSRGMISTQPIEVKEKNQTPSSRKIEVLIAEDNKVNLMLIGKVVLHAHNCNIDIAEDGDIAIQKAQEKKYDLIITDQQMPNLVGSEAVKQIRTFNPTVPIVVQSNQEGSELRKAFSDCNVIYLEGGKLVSIKQLNSLLDSLNFLK